jgi:hypothetical protein
MAGETESEQRAEEWAIVARNVDNIDVFMGRNGKPPLMADYEQRFGEQNVDWRVVAEPLSHDMAGRWAQTLGMYPVHVEVTVGSINHEKQRLHGLSRDEWMDGLSKMTKQ